MRAARLSPELPGNLAVLYDYRAGKFETPLDGRGIADVDALFELAIHTYPDPLPSFDNTERNIHHIYWTEQFWKNLAARQSSADAETIHDFRNSTPQLAYVPLELHAWIEEVMVPPPPPSLEVMRRRNAAWRVARILLQGAEQLDQARSDYDNKKDTTRKVSGWIPGITSVSQRTNEEPEERLNRDYWFSELNSRLEGWKKISDFAGQVPAEDRIIPAARLATVRSLHSRIRNGAMVPRIPTNLPRAS